MILTGTVEISPLFDYVLYLNAHTYMQDHLRRFKAKGTANDPRHNTHRKNEIG